MKLRKTKIALYFMFALAVPLKGCIFFPAFMHPGYGGEVVADIEPQAREPIDARLLRLREFKGPDKVQGGDVRRLYYTQQIQSRNDKAQTSFDLYFGPLREVASGWGYAVYVKNWDLGKREDVQKEIDSLLDDVRQTLQKQFPNAKITVRTYRFSPP